MTFTAEEVYPDELFGEDTEGTCILAVLSGYFKELKAPDTVTVISPPWTRSRSPSPMTAGRWRSRTRPTS